MSASATGGSKIGILPRPAQDFALAARYFRQTIESALRVELSWP